MILQEMSVVGLVTSRHPDRFKELRRRFWREEAREAAMVIGMTDPSNALLDRMAEDLQKEVA